MKEIEPDFLGGRYIIFEDGRVFGKYRNLFMSPKTDRDGYKRLTLSVSKKKKEYLVHRLVLMAFSGNSGKGMHVDHINCNRGDNRLENLRWMTPEDHYAHRVSVGHVARGDGHGQAKAKEGDVRRFKKLINSNNRRGSIKEAAVACGIPLPTAYKIKEGRNWGWIDAG